MIDRREAVATLLSERARANPNLLVVSGLGQPTWDLAAAGDSPFNFYLWGAMGGAAAMGLGLALARPAHSVLVLTGDGEMLMGLGSLATLGAAQPRNLALVVLDNGRYGETGRQASHTALGTDLAAVARAVGFTDVRSCGALSEVAVLGPRLLRREGLLFARIAIAAEEPPRVLPEKDAVVLKNRFRAALA